MVDIQSYPHPGLLVEMPPVHSTCLYAVRVEAHLCASIWVIVKPGQRAAVLNRTVCEFLGHSIHTVPFYTTPTQTYSH